jgi:outer membrane receptor protein involved in Fe transport
MATAVPHSESQEPLLLAGYHHEWAPGSHTLLLAGRFDDTIEVMNPQHTTLVLDRDANGAVIAVSPVSMRQTYRSEQEIYTGEVQQIWQRGDHTLIAGGRFQAGGFETHNVSVFPPNQPENENTDFARTSLYLYEQWQVLPPLLLIGGVSYDRLEAPRNFRYAPISAGEETTERVSPKAGLIFTPHRTTTLRAGYAQSLGGVSFDQSFALEPTQVAGFNQAWRSLIPESVAGANSGARFEIGRRPGREVRNWHLPGAVVGAAQIESESHIWDLRFFSAIHHRVQRHPGEARL